MNTTLIKLPLGGEELDVGSAPGAVRALQALAEFRREIGNVERQSRETLRAEADARGQRTFTVDGQRVTVENPSYERSYDVARLEDGLAVAGLDTQRLSELIVWEPKVDGMIIRQLERHPAYKKVIDAATVGLKEKTRIVKVG
jgi:hypothetical protein